MRASITPALVALAACAGLAAAPPAWARPNFTGVWMVNPDYYLGKPLKPAPELSPLQRELNSKRAALRPADYVRSVSNMLCTPRGGPALFVIRSPFVIMEGFGRISFIFETEGSNQPRTIYLDKQHGPDIYPSFNGHSVGRWEGDTLVVDTVGFNGRGDLFNGVPKSEKTHVVERFSWSADGKVMTLDITMEDPVALAKPWTTQIKFDRRPDDEERFEVWCEVDLEAFKAVDLNAVKAFDPEVARMLDPELNPADPALKISQAK